MKLKISKLLEGANYALKVERQDRKSYEAMEDDAKMRERQVYEDRVQNIKDHIKNFFTKLNDEVTLKSMTNLLKLQQLPSPPTMCDQSQQNLPQGSAIDLRKQHLKISVISQCRP